MTFKEGRIETLVLSVELRGQDVRGLDPAMKNAEVKGLWAQWFRVGQGLRMSSAV